MPASAADEGLYVTNYSWIQWARGTAAFVGTIAPGDLTAAGALWTQGHGYGGVDDFRVGQHVWIPNAAMTSGGTDLGWAAIDLGTARSIEKVSVDLFWNGSSTGYTIQAANGNDINNLTWVTIGYADLTKLTLPANRSGGYYTSAWGGDLATVIDPSKVGEYRFVRVVFDAGTSGVGLYTLEPIGSGYLTEGDKVNWVNGPNFETSVTGFGTMDINNAQVVLNSGNLSDLYNHPQSNDWRMGAVPANWAKDINDTLGETPKAFIEIDLGTTRAIDEAAVVWDGSYGANYFDLLYFDDDLEEWVKVDGTVYNIATSKHVSGLTGLAFNGVEPIEAQYWRIINVTGLENTHALTTQVMLFGPGPVVPEPVTMSLLALGGLALLRRRK